MTADLSERTGDSVRGWSAGLAGVRPRGPIAHGAMALVAMFVGFGVYFVGAHDIARLRGNGPAKQLLLGDTTLSLREVATAPGGTAHDRDTCRTSVSEYRDFLTKVRPTPPSAPEVRVEMAPDVYCAVIDERSSPWAGIEVLAGSLLAALSVILILPGLWLVRLVGDPRNVVAAVGIPVAAVVVVLGALTTLLAGAVRGQPHFIFVELAGLAIFALPCAVLMSVHRSCADGEQAHLLNDPETIDAALEVHRRHEAAVRLSSLLLSLLLSLTVFDLYAMSRRLAVWTRGASELNVFGTFVGGFRGRTADIVVAIEGAFFVGVMLAIAAPAMLALEVEGAEVAAAVRGQGTLVGHGVERLSKREATLRGLGLARGLFQNAQSALALAGPLITSLVASAIGQ